MTVYQTRIVPAERDPRVLPVAEIYLACAFGDCKAEFHLPLAPVPIPTQVWDQPRIRHLAQLAEQAGWSWHLGPRCPAHPHGRALALPELEPPGTAHKRVQAITDTAEIDVDAVKAALAEQPEAAKETDDAEH